MNKVRGLLRALEMAENQLVTGVAQMAGPPGARDDLGARHDLCNHAAWA